MAARLQFLYDFSCPYAYLASTRVEAIASRYGAHLEWAPVLLGGLLKAWSQPQRPAEAMSPPRAKNNALDIMRWARYHGVPLQFPKGHPRRTVEALRLVLAAPEPSWPALSHALYKAYWVDGVDVTDRDQLGWVATATGLDGQALLARIDAPDIKDELRRRTDEAVARGVFGVPTCFVGEAMFWGQDRLQFVERVLAGERVPGPEALPAWGQALGPQVVKP